MFARRGVGLLLLGLAGCQGGGDGAEGEARVVVQALLADPGVHVVYDLRLLRVRADDPTRYEPLLIRNGLAANQPENGLREALLCAGGPQGRAHQIQVDATVLDANGAVVGEAHGTQGFLCVSRQSTPVKLALQVLGGGRTGVANVAVGIDERDADGTVSVDQGPDGATVESTVAVGAGAVGPIPVTYRLLGESNCQLAAFDSGQVDPLGDDHPQHYSTATFSCPAAVDHEDVNLFAATQGQHELRTGAIAVQNRARAQGQATGKRTMHAETVASFQCNFFDGSSLAGAVVDAWGLVPDPANPDARVAALGVRLYSAANPDPDGVTAASMQEYFALKPGAVIPGQGQGGGLVGPELMPVLGVGAIDEGENGFILLLAPLDTDAVQVSVSQDQGIDVVDAQTGKVLIQDNGLHGWIETGLVVEGDTTRIAPRLPVRDALYAVRCSAAPGKPAGCETDPNGYLHLTDLDTALRAP